MSLPHRRTVQYVPAARRQRLLQPDDADSMADMASRPWRGKGCEMIRYTCWKCGQLVRGSVCLRCGAVQMTIGVKETKSG